MLLDQGYPYVMCLLCFKCACVGVCVCVFSVCVAVMFVFWPRGGPKVFSGGRGGGIRSFNKDFISFVSSCSGGCRGRNNNDCVGTAAPHTWVTIHRLFFGSGKRGHGNCRLFSEVGSHAKVLMLRVLFCTGGRGHGDSRFVGRAPFAHRGINLFFCFSLLAKGVLTTFVFLDEV